MSLEGKVAFITGAARGQGRAHAVRLAREGVKIVGIDICEDIASMDYPNASEADLAETVKLVEAQGAAMIATKADVREYAAVKMRSTTASSATDGSTSSSPTPASSDSATSRTTSSPYGTTSSARTSPACSTR